MEDEEKAATGECSESSNDGQTNKSMNKFDSGISVEKSDNSSEDDEAAAAARPPAQEDEAKPFKGFKRTFISVKSRKYRKRNPVVDDESDGCDEQYVSASTSKDTDSIKSDSSSEDHMDCSPRLRRRSNRLKSEDGDEELTEFNPMRVMSEPPPLITDDEESTCDDKRSDDTEDQDAVMPSVLLKTSPKQNWFPMNDILKRQLGAGSQYHWGELFRLRASSSLHFVQRLELQHKLLSHKGCVNALNFNTRGNLLASGSDDLMICVWDWVKGKKAFSYTSGHATNVFQSKFLPLHGDTHLVSCARDGQVRIAELSSTGSCKGTRRLLQHRGPCHKLATHPDNPHTILSCGEDAAVFSLDVRTPRADNRLLIVKSNQKRIPLYSIHSNPMNEHEFCVSGRDHFIRIYDRRYITPDLQLKKYVPLHLADSEFQTNVTCAVFSNDGSEVIGTYNDDDIYLFNTFESEGAPHVHCYQGHRNNATVKAVNFFGARSEYVISGSDCGHIYFWDKHTEAIVQFLKGDEAGVVNCLETHPSEPVLATSGLDDDVKIWAPTSKEVPDNFKTLRKAITENHKLRAEEVQDDRETVDGQMLWILWRHIRRTERRNRRQAAGQEVEDSSSSDNDGNDSDDDPSEEDVSRSAVQCVPS